MTCGIYMIKRKDTGQMYIGQSVDIERRWRQHIRKGNDKSYIDKAINKHGQDNFILIIIEEVSKKQLNNREQYWINYYNTYKDDMNYNLTPGGDFNPMKVPEIAQKISKVMSGENNPNYGKTGKNNPFYGKKHSEETKRKMSENHWDCSGENHYLYGKHLKQETKKKLSKAMMGRKHSLKSKEKMSKNKNTTGYYRVSKVKSDRYKQGYRFCYFYYDENNKRKSICRTKVDTLQKAVMNKGLVWKKLEGFECQY